MPRFTKPGHPPVESSAPRDRANLLAQGYREEKAHTQAPATPPARVPERPAAKPAEKKD